MSSELRVGGPSIVAEKKTSGYREPDIADDVGIAEEAGEAVPVREFEFAFCTVDDGFAERYGKADGGIQDLVIVGKVVDVAAEKVCVPAGLAEEALGRPALAGGPVWRLDWTAEPVGAQDKHGWGNCAR